MNIETVARKCLKNTLQANASIRSLLAYPGAPTMYRIFGETVDPSVPLPYVTIEWYAGGLDEKDVKRDTLKSMWKIAAHVKETDEGVALEIADAIYSALHRQWPVMGSVTGYAGNAPILLRYPYSDTVFRQGHTVYRKGGIYTLRLAETG